MKCSVPELVLAVCEWYDLEGNETGGPLHIVVDDYNVEDQFLDSCREAILNDPAYDHFREVDWTTLGVKILDGLYALDVPTRKKVLQEAWRVYSTKTS